MKFRQNLAVKMLSVMAAVSVLASCGSAPSKVSSKNNSSVPRTATGDDPQKFGAKYSGRSYQQSILSPVASVENKSAVVNQGDFLTQLSTYVAIQTQLPIALPRIMEKLQTGYLQGLM